MNNKVELIREISQFHPGHEAGLKRGWSTYAGGMIDNGDWNFWKMYDDATVEELNSCLKELTDERQAAERWAEATLKEEQPCLEKLFSEFENKILWGIK